MLWIKKNVYHLIKNVTGYPFFTRFIIFLWTQCLTYIYHSDMAQKRVNICSTIGHRGYISCLFFIFNIFLIVLKIRGWWMVILCFFNWYSIWESWTYILAFEARLTNLINFISLTINLLTIPAYNNKCNVFFDYVCNKNRFDTWFFVSFTVLIN